MKILKTLMAATALTAISASAAVAEKWDMPMAYSATNFHSAVGAEFAKCVTTGTSGGLETRLRYDGRGEWVGCEFDAGGELASYEIASEAGWFGALWSEA